MAHTQHIRKGSGDCQRSHISPSSSRLALPPQARLSQIDVKSGQRERTKCITKQHLNIARRRKLKHTFAPLTMTGSPNLQRAQSSNRAKQCSAVCSLLSASPCHCRSAAVGLKMYPVLLALRLRESLTAGGSTSHHASPGLVQPLVMITTARVHRTVSCAPVCT